MAERGPTRKERVQNYLFARRDEWVCGHEIINRDVGGSRAGARIFDINQDGVFHVESRPDPHPNHDTYQYRLTVVERPPVYVQQVLLGPMP